MLLVTLIFNYIFIQTKHIDIVYPFKEGAQGLIKAIGRICAETSCAVKDGYCMLVLSDIKAGREFVPVR